MIKILHYKKNEPTRYRLSVEGGVCLISDGLAFPKEGRKKFTVVGERYRQVRECAPVEYQGQKYWCALGTFTLYREDGTLASGCNSLHLEAYIDAKKSKGKRTSQERIWRNYGGNLRKRVSPRMDVATEDNEDFSG